jgi:hypothetical protein
MAARSRRMSIPKEGLTATANIAAGVDAGGAADGAADGATARPMRRAPAARPKLKARRVRHPSRTARRRSLGPKRPGPRSNLASKQRSRSERSAFLRRPLFPRHSLRRQTPRRPRSRTKRRLRRRPSRPARARPVGGEEPSAAANLSAWILARELSRCARRNGRALRDRR